ncbi:deoxyribonuclease V [Moellerella wisconsensis]|uniref:deoxyribonuclease V n=1 Tax=Moellerella wisconsensis TaxID=158849 RepID=UPI0030762178
MAIDTSELRQQQLEKSRQVVLTDDFATPRLIAGADVGFEQQGTVTRAAIAVMTWPELELIEYQIARIPTLLPYIPGLLSFRECPALYEAWQLLQHKPQLVLIDGQGIAHPRYFGVACHFGLLVDIPTIGVAKSRLFGTHSEIEQQPGSYQPLMDKTQQLGWVLRSKKRCNPLYISPGHKVSLASSLWWVEQCLKGYRLPEPTRMADGIASNRTKFKRMINKSR